jgi:F-type H+-transporting ATPase subunit gamma
MSLTFDLTRRWWARHEAGDLAAVDVIYNAYRGLGQYEPTVTRLIPPSDVPLAALEQDVEAETFWPPPIIETDPVSLRQQVIEQWTSVSLYRILLDSAAAEHATRYQLMEAATQNAERLIAELTLAVQTARQQEITREMQELTAGAGLLGRQ